MNNNRVFTRGAYFMRQKLGHYKTDSQLDNFDIVCLVIQSLRWQEKKGKEEGNSKCSLLFSFLATCHLLCKVRQGCEERVSHRFYITHSMQHHSLPPL